MDLNRVILIGRLAADPELRYLPSGDGKATFRLAVGRPGKDGERMTDFIDCVAWRKHATVLGEHARKGETLAIEGRIQVRTFETDDGAKRRVVEVHLTDFSFAGKARENGDADAPRPTRGRPDGETENESEPPVRRPARASSSRRPARSRSRPSRPPASPAPVTTPAENEDVPF